MKIRPNDLFDTDSGEIKYSFQVHEPSLKKWLNVCAGQKMIMFDTKEERDKVMCRMMEIEPPLKGSSACVYCNGEGEIEMDNNGPICPCPICTD